jgi:hypothetical protein
MPEQPQKLETPYTAFNQKSPIEKLCGQGNTSIFYPRNLICQSYRAVQIFRHFCDTRRMKTENDFQPRWPAIPAALTSTVRSGSSAGSRQSKCPLLPMLAHPPRSHDHVPAFLRLCVKPGVPCLGPLAICHQPSPPSVLACKPLHSLTLCKIPAKITSHSRLQPVVFSNLTPNLAKKCVFYFTHLSPAST